MHKEGEKNEEYMKEILFIEMAWKKEKNGHKRIIYIHAETHSMK